MMIYRNKVGALFVLLCAGQCSQIHSYNFDMMPLLRVNLAVAPAAASVVTAVQAAKSFCGKNRYKAWCLAREEKHLRGVIEYLESVKLNDVPLYKDSKARLERVIQKSQKVSSKIVRTDNEYDNDIKVGIGLTVLTGGLWYVVYKIWNVDR